MPSPIIFEYNNELYSVSEEKFDRFKADFPDATTTVNGEKVKAMDYSFGKEPTVGKQESKPVQQPTEQPQVQEQPQSAEQPQPTEDSYHPSAIEKRQMQANLAAMSARTQGYVSNALETIGNIEDYAKKGGLTGGVKEETVVDPTTMTLQKSYLTPMGERYEDKVQAESDTRKDAEWRANQTVSGQLRKIDDDRKRIYDLMNERLKEIEADYKKDEDARSGFVKFLSSVGNASRTGGAKGMSLIEDELQTRINTDPEYSRLKTAMNYLDDREALLKREKRREEGKSVGFWRGVGTALFDMSAWDLGFSDLMDQMNLSNTADVLEHFNELPDGSAGKEMIRQYILNQQAQEEYGKNDSKMFQYGVMGGQMIPFMVDFAVTFGGFDAINFATKGATKLSTKLIGKAAMDAIAKDGVKAFVKNEGKGAIGKVATNWTVKALGITSDELTRGLLMANTVQGMKTASNIVENKRGNAIEEDENGNLHWTGGMSTGEAIWQAEADATIENASEMFGAHLTPIMGKVGEKLSKVIGIKRLSGVLAQSDRAALRNMRKTIKQGFEKLGVSGYLEEVSEEYWAQVEKSVLGLNTAYQENEDGTRTNLFANGEFHADIWAGMAYSIGVMNGGQLTMQAGWYCNAKHNVNLADRRAGAIWGDQWNKLRQQIDNLTNDQVPAFTQLIATDPNMTDAERGAITGYIWQMLQMRGFNMASEVETREQKPQHETLTPDEIARRVKERAEKPEDLDAPESGAAQEEGNTDFAQKANAAYIDGYDAKDSEEIANSNAINQQLRERAQQRFGDDLMERLDNDGVVVVNEMRKQGYSEDDIRLAEEYVISNNVMNGIRQAVFDRTEEDIVANNTRIGQNTKEDGTIQKATLTDGREVYVLAGIIPLNADGTINKNGVIDSRELSGVSVRDAETGEVEMVPLRDIASAEHAQNATDIMEREEQEIKERAFEAYNQAIGGTVQATAGATYDITTPDGEGATVEVVPDANGQTETDEGINVSVNGGEQKVMPREELQAGVDAARTEQMAAQADESKEPTALEQIPRDENGEPLYEQAESVGVAYRGLVEQCEGDEQMARDVAEEMLEDAKKERDKAKKTKPKTGTTITEKIQARREQQAAVAAAEEKVAFWKQMTEQPTLEEQAQAQQQTEEEQQPAKEQTEREEEQQPAKEQTTEEQVQPEQTQPEQVQPEQKQQEHVQPKTETQEKEQQKQTKQTERTEQVSEKGEGYSITPSQYTKKNGDVVDMQLVTFDDELTSDERKALSSEARNKKGWYDRNSGGFMMRSAEDARALAEKYKSIHKQELQKQEKEQQREKAAEKETQAAQTKEIPVEEQSSDLREVTDSFAEQIEGELKGLGVPARVARSAEELVEMARETGVNIPLEQARMANAFVHNGVVYINAERMTEGRSVEEAMQRGREIVMHEAVAHIGLEKLMGKEGFTQFCDAVFKGMGADARDRWKGYFFDNNLNKKRRRELLAKYGAAEDARWDDLTAAQQKRIEEELGDRMRRGAADEYAAKLAERVARGEKLGKQAKSVWKQIVDAVRRLFGLDSKDSGMTEVDIARALAASKQNLRDTERLAEIAEELQSADILRQAELIDERNSIEDAMREREQQRQQTNKEARREPSDNAEDTSFSVEDMSEEERRANERFNEEIDSYIDGDRKANTVFHLGTPMGVMRHFLPDMPIVMRPRILNKASNKKHNVGVDDLYNLPEKISSPIFVFKRNDETIGVLTELNDRDGKNVCVGIELAKEIQDNGNFITVNDVRSVHGRDVANILSPIAHNNTLKWVDKEKGLNWLSSASTNYQQEIDNSQDLNSVTKIIENFENPKFSEEKNTGDARFSIEEEKRAELTEELQDARERHDILAQAQAIAELDQMDREQAERDVRFSVSDEVQKSRERMREEHKAAMESKENALERIGGSMRELRDAMRVQRQYDQASVDSLVKLAQEMIGRGMFSNATDGEVKRLLGAVRGGLRGGKGFEESVDKLTDIMISSGLREGKKALSDLCKVRRKTNSAGVAIGGKLDTVGEQMIASFKGAMTWDTERIQERMEELQDRIDTDDKAAAEYIGLTLADAYRETVTQREADEAALRDDMDNVPEGLNSEQRREYIRSIEEAIRKSKLDRIEALAKIADILRGERGESMSRSAAFRQAEKERVNKIHHMQNSDMEGRKSDEHRQESLWDMLLNSSLVRFLFSPLATFDYMLRLFGNKNVHGEGYLWNYFMRSYEHAVENETKGMEEATKRLDTVVSNGGLVRWSDLYGLEKRMPRITVSFLDGGEMKEHSLTQGQALYIYMVNKMDDGAMKLRAMGITAEEVERIAGEIDQNFIQLADWIQDVFLPDMRKKYNAVYERLFGTSMDEIANYFPLKILSDARMEEVDVSEEGNNKGGARMPSTVTGSIVRRKRNTTALDLLGADAFSVVIEHLQQMEHWAAFAEFNRDINTMLSYKRFKNQVKNMKSIYGSGNTLWKNFKNVCSIAAGTYTPTVGRDSIDKAAVNIAKGVTAAKIAYRLYTAVKQLLSLPAFFSDVSTVSIAKSMATPSASWNWAMENLPMFRKRWLSRQVGDTRLMKTDLDWRFWKNNIIKKIGLWGMTPNAFVDALTIAVGSKAVYDTRFNQYIKDGYSEEDAKQRAAEDAAVVYNESQQSSENSFLSAMQLDRTVASVSLSVFRNASMGYERRFLQSMRNLGRLLKDKDFMEKSIAFMTKQGVRNGLTEEQAGRAAQKEFARGIRRDAVRLAIFGFVVQFAWNLGGYLPYLFMGGSGDDKKKLAEDAAQHALFGSIEGLAGGNIYSEVGNMLLNGENVSNYDPTMLPVMSDIRNLLRTMNRDEIQGINDMVNLFIQAGVGVNPQTVEDSVVAIIDACGGDMDTGREVILLLSRIMQVPQSQLDMLYFDNLDLWGDEAKGMLPSELAERYAKYKVMRGSALAGVAYSQEGMEQALDRWREKARQKEKAFLYAGDGGEEDRIYQMLGNEAKEVSKEIRKINKIKESDPTTYKNRMKELAATDRYKHYRLYKECTGVMDKYAKRWLDAQTKEEKDAAQEAVNDLKVRIAVKLDEMEKKEN